MNTLTLTQLKKWDPCKGWIARFENDYGHSATMDTAESAAWSAESAEYRWQLKQLHEIEGMTLKTLRV